MSEFEVSAVTRTETGKSAVRRLRTRGLVPGILYGAGVDPVRAPPAPATVPEH